jgi:aryl-alcohol dehydrogenase-like predicted oxidoreductase
MIINGISTERDDVQMEKRQLGKSGIYSSTIGMGCWSYGGGQYWGEQSQTDVNRLVQRAIDIGINLFDTAEMYNDGESEKSLGISLQNRRHDVVICSKVGPDNAYAGILEEHCDASLKRLNTDYIDLYMLHWPLDPISVKHFTSDENKINCPPTVDEAFSSLMRLQEKGKIRCIGISNFGIEQTKAAIATGAQIAVNEMPYNVLSRAIEVDVLPYSIENNISIIGSMALQQGLLAGIYNSAKDVPPNQAHSRHFSHKSGRGASRHGEEGAEAEVFKAISELKEIANELNIHIAQLSIAWILAKNGISATLVGSRNVTELQTNIEAATISLPDSIIHQIDIISKPVLDKLGSNIDYYESSKNSRIR